MKAITLRNLPPELASLIERNAAEEGLSLNRTVIRLLEKAAGTRGQGGGAVVHHDLDHLAGAWSRAEADAFERALADQRKVDPELWR